MVEKTIAIEDKHGISRLANVCEFVKTVNHFDCEIKLKNEISHYETNGRDIMQFIHLISDGDLIRATFNGSQEREASEFVANYFLTAEDYAS